MHSGPFDFCRTPRLLFGPGRLREVGAAASRYASAVLVVTGGRSLDTSGAWSRCRQSLSNAPVTFHRYCVPGEPSPEMVDGAVREYGSSGVGAVVAIGGGSVIDCAKAIAAMLPLQQPVADYLEGVGTKTHPGATLPVVAVPTTAGTGSEATKNAVISAVGTKGFKKSLRHDNLVPVCAIVDPELVSTCPPEVTAACGMDAFTQLLESYVSPQASPVTDALALNGMEQLSRSLIPAVRSENCSLETWSGLSYAAFLSGVTLANAGLGVIHGLASPIGALTRMPHGMVCATLLAHASRMNIRRLGERDGGGSPALVKYAAAGRLVAGRPGLTNAQACDALVDTLDQWTAAMGIPRLGAYGLRESDLPGVAAQAGQKCNPVQLEADDLVGLLRYRL